MRAPSALPYSSIVDTPVIAATGGDDVAVNGDGLRRGQEGDDVADVARLDDPADRGRLSLALEHLVERDAQAACFLLPPRLDELGSRHPGHHYRHVDPGRPELDRQVLRQRDHRRIAHAPDYRAGPTCAHAGDVDDAA